MAKQYPRSEDFSITILLLTELYLYTREMTTQWLLIVQNLFLLYAAYLASDTISHELRTNIIVSLDQGLSQTQR